MINIKSYLFYTLLLVTVGKLDDVTKVCAIYNLKFSADNMKSFSH